MRETLMPPKKISIGNEDETVFEAIREIAGDDIADALSLAAGGTRVQLPGLSNFSETSAIASLVGYEYASRVMEAVGVGVPLYFYVPLGLSGQVQSTGKRIEALLQNRGMSVRDIARQTGVCDRTVYRHRAKLREREHIAARVGGHK